MKKALLTVATVLAVSCLQAKEQGAAPAGIHAKAPLSFIENKGQVVDQDGRHRSDIDYKLVADGMVMFIGDGQLHYQWSRLANSKVNSQNSKTSDPASSTDFYRMDVTLLGANKNAKVVAEEAQAYYENYYLPQCPGGAVAHSYSKITYKNVYPNIDWVIYISHESEVMSRESKNTPLHPRLSNNKELWQPSQEGTYIPNGRW